MDTGFKRDWVVKVNGQRTMFVKAVDGKAARAEFTKMHGPVTGVHVECVCPECGSEAGVHQFCSRQCHDQCKANGGYTDARGMYFLPFWRGSTEPQPKPR